MSSHIQPQIKTYCLEGASEHYTFVKFGSADDKVAQSLAGERAFGINMTSDLVDKDFCEVAHNGGGALIKLAATVARGQSIKSDASGKGILAVAGDFAPCICMQSGVVGDVVSVFMNTHQAI